MSDDHSHPFFGSIARIVLKDGAPQLMVEGADRIIEAARDYFVEPELSIFNDAVKEGGKSFLGSLVGYKWHVENPTPIPNWQSKIDQLIEVNEFLKGLMPSDEEISDHGVFGDCDPLFDARDAIRSAMGQIHNASVNFAIALDDQPAKGQRGPTPKTLGQKRKEFARDVSIAILATGRALGSDEFKVIGGLLQVCEQDSDNKRGYGDLPCAQEIRRHLKKNFPNHFSS